MLNIQKYCLIFIVIYYNAVSLFVTFQDKKNYVVQTRVLKQGLNNGLTLKKMRNSI